MTHALTALDVVLVAGVLTTATLATFSRDRVVSVMMFLSLGVLLAVMWARLDAPDLAMAEAAIAAGVTGALLIGAVSTLRPTSIEGTERSRWTATAAQIVVVVVGTALLATALVTATEVPPGPPAAGPSASAAMSDSVVDHPITAVLLQFRSYDTLLEVVVLAAVAIVAFALPTDSAITPLGVRTDRGALFDGLVKVIVPVVLLLAGWLLVAGSTQPGGAFQAGALITGSLLLLYLAGRLRGPATIGRWWVAGVLIGPMVFIGVAVLTAAAGAGWLVFEEPWGGTAIVAVEAVLAVSIGVSLSAAFLAGRSDVPAVLPAVPSERGARR